MPYDEYTEMAIFHSNVEEYRLHWPFPIKEGYFASEGGQPISQSIEKDHGICAYYPLIPLLPWLRQDINTYSLVWSILTECWFLLGCIAVYGVCRNLGMGWLSSCAAVLLLYLCPRFFAEGHYNNKDVVLLCLFLLTFWQGARAAPQAHPVPGNAAVLFRGHGVQYQDRGHFRVGPDGPCHDRFPDGSEEVEPFHGRAGGRDHP